MIFVTIEDVDTILGATWAAQDKKALSVQDANDWLNGMKLCKGLEPEDTTPIGQNDYGYSN